MNPNTIVVTRQELFNILKNSPNRKVDDQFSFLREQIKKRTKCPDEGLVSLYHKITHFKSQFKTIWTQANRIEDRFLKNNKIIIG